jgi:hypothetical protein
MNKDFLDNLQQFVETYPIIIVRPLDTVHHRFPGKAFPIMDIWMDQLQ